MSRYCGEKNSEPILAAAQHWRRQALESNGSVLSDRSLWSTENAAALERDFVKNINEGEGTFIGKLEAQLANSGPAAQQLAAEMFWFMSLCPSNVGPSSKRELISTVWEWSGDRLRLDSEWLQDDVLHGVGSAGTAFNTHRWREFTFFIRFTLAFKALPRPESEAVLNDGWAMAQWLTHIEEFDKRQLRHMILFLLFPDDFERIFGGQDRSKIVAGFTDASLAEAKSFPALKIDRELARIRAEQQDKLPEQDLDFYFPPLRSVWKQPKTAPKTTALKEPSGPSSTATAGGPTPERGATTTPLSQHGSYGIEDALEELFVDEEQFQQMLHLLRTKKNVILQGPPGVGKTFFCRRLAYALITAKDPQRVGMVQFHQSYAYEDFIQGYRPSGEGFRLKNGIFFQFCDKARADPDHGYVFIIDEINRGNLSKVFGEMMMLIEADKRGPEWSIPLAYGDGPDDTFYVPSNLYIIGLMNTADRSLAMVDYALRRRFGFVNLAPAFDTEQFRAFLLDRDGAPAFVDRMIGLLIAVNQKIANDTANLGPGYRIGHSYFCTFDDGERPDESWYRRIIRTEIAPLLMEYWFDDPDRADALVKELMLS